MVQTGRAVLWLGAFETGLVPELGMKSRPLPRFLCDEMLGRLCRYLRAAGYDTVLANNGKPDSQLLREAAAESRRFLTLDRRILEHKAAAAITLLLPRGDLDSHAAFLSQAFHLDWLTRAFTRCLVDNSVLLDAPAEKRMQAPADANRQSEPMSVCPACGRIYWRGSHYRRMREKLERWQHQRTGNGIDAKN